MDDRRLQPIGQRHSLIIGTLTSRTAVNRDLSAAVQYLRNAVEVGIAWVYHPDQRRVGLFLTLSVISPRRDIGIVRLSALVGMQRPSTKTSTRRRTVSCQPGWSCM